MNHTLNILEKSAFKVPQLILTATIHLFKIACDEKGKTWNFKVIEKIALYLGMHLAISRILALSPKPYTETYAIHTLLRHSDVQRYIIAMQSYLRFASYYPRVIVYNDGSLTSNDIKLLSYIPRALVISENEFSIKFLQTYGKNSVLSFYRDTIPTTKKIIDFLSICDDTQKIMFFDSDVGFFSKPTEILTYLETSKTQKNALYISDIQNAYVCDSYSLKKIFHTKIYQRVNSGILCFPSNYITPNNIRYFFSQIYRNRNLYRYDTVWTEQTFWAVLPKYYTLKPLPSKYFIGFIETQKDTICRHYVHNSKYFFITDLLQFLD